MSANLFGNRFRLMSFGESHGVGLGVVIDGCPAGVSFNEALLKKEMQRRRPGVHKDSQEQIVSGRAEADDVEILSGVFEGKTLGTPIALVVRNKDARSEDYKEIKAQARVGHADDVWKEKFGHSDYRGGGRSSGRETLSRVMAGSVAKMFLREVSEVDVLGFSLQIGEFVLTPEEIKNAIHHDVDSFQARFPSPRHEEVRKVLLQAQADGESFGGVAEIVIRNPIKGLGQPVFHKLKSDLAQAYMSVGAVNGVEFGSGFEATAQKGTEFHSEGSEVYGGIRGGISTGEEIRFKVSMKPTSSILDVAKKGRHDPCIVIRAIPVLEAMTWIVLADHYLWAKTDRVDQF